MRHGFNGLKQIYSDKRIAISLLSIIVLLGLTGCMKRPYSTEDIARIRDQGRVIEVNFTTEDGEQSALYLPPESDPENIPETLIIVYPGYRSTGLDWLGFADQYSEPGSGFLLLDYPGMGKSEGMYRPKNLPATSRGALMALGRLLGAAIDSRTVKIVLFGHSFGCGAALQYATEISACRIVLIAPFTTLKRATFRRMGPLAWLIPNGIDNRKRLHELYDQVPRPDVMIIHGDRDRSIPVGMGRHLASLYPEWIEYIEVKGAGHVDIYENNPDLIYQALAGFHSPAQ